MTSVNFNAAATSALRTLQQSNALLDATQNRISTGLKIGEAKDNAAYWSISTSMKSDNKALGTVKDALGLGAGTVDTMYQGLDAARSVLDDMKAKLTSALNPSVDRAAVQNDIDAYLSSLKSIASSSVFSGENWLSVNSGVDGYSSQKQVVASYARAADGTVSIDTINVDTSKIALFDANANGSGIISSQATLTAGGKQLEFGGNAATGAAPALNGLDTSIAKAGLDVGVAAQAKVTLGTFSLGGIDKADRLSFNLSVDGGATKTISIKLDGILTGDTTNNTGLSDRINDAIAAASGFGSAVATADLVDGKIVLTSAVTGSASAISVSNLKAFDGDGVISGLGGLAPVTDFGAGGPVKTTAFTWTATTGASPPVGLVTGEKFSFRFTYNGDTYETATKTMANSDVASRDAYVTALQGMVNTATRVSDGTAIGNNKVLVKADSTAGILFQTEGLGPSQSLGIIDMKVDGVAPAAAGDVNGLIAAAATNTTAPTSDAATTGNITFGSSMKDGDKLTFDLTYYTDNASATGSVSLKKTVTVKTAADKTAFEANLQSALDAAFGANIFTVSAPSGTAFKIDTNKLGPNIGLSIANIAATDGDGVNTSTLGLTTGSVTGVGRDLAATATKGTVTSSSAFAGPLTFDAGDNVTFNFNLNGTTKAVTVNKATVDAALTSTDGKITTADQYATVLNAALTNAGVTGVTAKNDTGVIKFEANTAGASTLSVSDVKSSSGANTVSVNEISITSASFTALTNDQQTQLINAYINVVSDKLKAVTSAASNMGSVGARIESQKNFVSTLMDTIDKGISGLVDADMNEESTKLQALQVKQQLGVQALSIANQSAQNVLSLFRG